MYYHTRRIDNGSGSRRRLLSVRSQPRKSIPQMLPCCAHTTRSSLKCSLSEYSSFSSVSLCFLYCTTIKQKNQPFFTIHPRNFPNLRQRPTLCRFRPVRYLPVALSAASETAFPAPFTASAAPFVRPFTASAAPSAASSTIFPAPSIISFPASMISSAALSVPS